jgi:NADH-quinone oxidoreductase subunit M
MSYDIISVLTFFPIAGALILLLFPKISFQSAQRFALLISLTPLPFVIQILRHFDSGTAAVQFVNKLPWIPSLGVDYFVGLDGLSITMVLLVSIITPAAILGVQKWVDESSTTRYGPKAFFALILIEQTGLYGAFTALNFFHWFIFWEATLVPMFFLIKLYGGRDRTHAAYQFFLYTFAGSVAMLIGMQFVYLATGSWDFIELAARARTVVGETGMTALASDIQNKAAELGIPFITQHSTKFIFLLVLFGFAIKVPMWPFHTWLPVTYTQSPTAGSMILTGLMSKMGVYGFLRIVLPLFGASVPRSWFIILMVLAILTILLGAIAALAQRDIKTVVAYSSISHLGYCLLGIFAVGSLTPGVDERALALNGVLVQMFAHGLSAAGLFYFAGLIEERTQTRDITELGGLRKTLPVMCGLMGIVTFASLGLPGLAGFVGEYMIFQGAFPLSMTLVGIAVLGILLTALYLLYMLGKVFFGPQNDRWNSLPDLTGGERFLAVLFAISLFWVGLWPTKLIELSNRAVVHLAQIFS